VLGEFSRVEIQASIETCYLRNIVVTKRPVSVPAVEAPGDTAVLSIASPLPGSNFSSDGRSVLETAAKATDRDSAMLSQLACLGAW